MCTRRSSSAPGTRRSSSAPGTRLSEAMSIEDCLFVCLNKMLVHAFFACRACAQCLDYARNNVWNAIILEAVPGNE